MRPAPFLGRARCTGRAPGSRQRGYLLLTTLLVVGLLFSMGLAVLQFATHHQQWLRKAEGSALARQAARSGIQMALAELSGPEAPSSIRRTLDESELVVDVHPNRTGEAFVEPDGRIVPPACAHLVSRGRARGSESVYEALVRLPVTLYENDFDRAASEWSQTSLKPVVLLGSYVLDLGLQGFAVAGDPDWRDYEAEWTAKLAQGTGVGFMVRVTGPLESPSGYLLEHRPGELRLLRLDHGMTTLLAQAPTSLSILGLEHRYRIRADGSLLQVWLDDGQRPAFEVRDDRADLNRGCIGIRPMLGAVVLVDSVRVRQLLEVISQWRC